MKKIFFATAMLALFVSGFTQAPEADGHEFVLKGNLAGTTENDWLHIAYKDKNNASVRDSVRVSSGSFVYKGVLRYPQPAMLVFKAPGDKTSGYISLFLEPGTITVQGSLDEKEKILVEGGAINDENRRFGALTADLLKNLLPYNKKYNALNLQYNTWKKEGRSEEELKSLKMQMEALRDSMQPVQQQIQARSADYFRKHPDSYITVSQLRYHVSRMNPDSLQALYDRMSNEVRASYDGQALAEEIARLRSGSAGSKAVVFSGVDINGKPLSLTDFRGKYILLDFWASWCAPCRKGNPHLLKLYNQYESKGFEIIGVSDDDRNPEAWKQAVANDGIGVWKHVLRGLKTNPDGSFDRSADKSAAYGIHTLPTKILIDPQGTIVGRYGGGGERDEALDEKLARIFDK